MIRIAWIFFTITLIAQSPFSRINPQIWEDGRTVLTTLDADQALSIMVHGRSSLIALDRNGVIRELRRPKTLRRPLLTHWKGRSLAYGFPPHPAWHFPDLGKRAWSNPPQALADAYQRSEHHLFQSTDFRTWQLLGRYRPDEDSHGKIRDILPLEDGSFLASPISFFWMNDRVSPVARYRLDGHGHLMFENLVELGASGIFDTIPHPTRPGQKTIRARSGYEGIERNDWLTARTPEGVVMIHRAGWYFVLDNRDGHCLREGRLRAPEGKTLRILDAQPGPDGRILLASTELRGKDEVTLSPFGRLGNRPPERLARHMMLFKGGHQRLVNDLEGPTPLRWHRLNPATGSLSQELPPIGIPTSLKDREARWTFCFTVRPDGNLTTFQRLHERRWWGI